MNFEICSSSCTVKLSSLGGQLTSIKKEETEYLWQGDPAFWGGQAPVCFPIVGALKNGAATAFGRRCAMPRHGVARTQDFHVLEQKKNSILFSLRANDQTLAQFPFAFELRIRYTLNGNTLTNEYTVINCGSSPMPYAIGGHPAFRCPLLEGESFEDYHILFEQIEDKAPLRPSLDTGLISLEKRYPVLREGKVLPLAHSLFYEDSLIFDTLCSKKVTLQSKKSGFGVEVCFEDFPNLLIWSSANDGEFVALEPWSAMAACIGETDCLEQREQFHVLSSNELKKYRFQCRLLGKNGQ